MKGKPPKTAGDIIKAMHKANCGVKLRSKKESLEALKQRKMELEALGIKKGPEWDMINRILSRKKNEKG